MLITLSTMILGVSRHFIDISIVAIYLIMMIVVGLSFRRFNRDVSDYFRSGARGTWWLVGSSIFMSSFSAWTFTGAAGVAYESGWSVMHVFFASATGLFINFLFVAAWMRQLRAVTAPEVIAARFGVATQQAYAYISVLINVLFAALALYGLALFSATIFGLPLIWVIIGVGVVVLVYSTIGGSWAVMATDFLQSLVLIPLTVIVALLCLSKLGGIGGMFERISEQGLSEKFQLISPGGRSGSEFTIMWALAMFAQNVWTTNTLSSAPRYFAAKDGATAQKAALLAMILFLMGAFIWFVPPVTARLLYESQVEALQIPKPAEAAYAVVSMKLLPSGLTGLMVIAMFSATMSSMDTGLNRTAAIIVRDIWPPCARRFPRLQLSPVAALRLSRAISFMLGLAIIVLAWRLASDQDRGVFEHMLNLTSMLVLPMAIPMLLGMFFRRAPWWSAIFSAGAALAAATVAAFSPSEWTYQQKVFVNLGTGIAAFFLSMPFWCTASLAYRRRVTDFFKRMHTPVDFEVEIGSSSDFSQMAVLGTYAMVMSAMILLITFLPNTAMDRLIVIVLGLSVAIVGLTLLLAAYTSKRRTVTQRDRRQVVGGNGMEPDQPSS